MRVVVVAVLVASSPAHADLANNELIHAHVDDTFAHLDVASLDPAQRDALLADRLTLSLGALVPIYGSIRLDRKVFGGVRPAAIVFDWVLGGVAPATLGALALAEPAHRAAYAWTALGLYAATRLGVLVVGNLHVSSYNHAVRVHLGPTGVAATW